MPGDFTLGVISAENLSGGYYEFAFAARTSPAHILDPAVAPENFLDPAVLFDRLSGAHLVNGTPVMVAHEVANSWLDVATQNRVLITFRDEWNQPLVAHDEMAIISGGVPVTEPLTIERKGTIAAPPGAAHYVCQIAERMLTRVPSTTGAAESVSIAATTPGHYVIGTARPDAWFHPTEPAHTKPLPLYTNDNKVEPLVDGFAAYQQLVADIRQINGADPLCPPCGLAHAPRLCLVAR